MPDSARPPRRVSLPDCMGRPFSLPADATAWERHGQGRDILILGLGPACPWDLPFVRQVQNTGARIFWLEAPQTLQALAQAGIQIRQEAQSFYIPGGQTYRTPERCCAEGDWSNAAFWLCAGGLSEQTVCCTNLDKHSLQGDKAVAELLSVFGAKVDWQGDACCVQTAPLQGIRIDAADIPDLVPVLAVVACGAEGETVITNAQRLRLKESDRLQTVYEMLYALGADITMYEDGFRIVGKGCLKGGTVEAHGDHRIAMAAAVAACICQQPVTVCGAQAVQKSYPGFFEDMQSLGAQIMLEEI